MPKEYNYFTYVTCYEQHRIVLFLGFVKPANAEKAKLCWTSFVVQLPNGHQKECGFKVLQHGLYPAFIYSLCLKAAAYITHNALRSELQRSLLSKSTSQVLYALFNCAVPSPCWLKGHPLRQFACAALSEATKHSHIKFTPSPNQDQQRFTCNIIERVPG